MIDLGSHSRSIPLLANIQSQILTIAEDRNDATTYLVSVLNAVDGIAPFVSLTGDYTGPSGSTTPILTQLGTREQVQFYVTGSFNLLALASLATTIEVSVTATGGGFLAVPPISHFLNAGFAAFVGMSGNNGYAPPGRRWWTVFCDVTHDIQLVNELGVVMFQSLAMIPAAPTGPMILPPGLRLQGKGNVANARITTVWSQRSSG